MAAHTLHKCAQPCERQHCVYCDGGLAFCTVCKGAEGSLPTECPGVPMSDEAQRDVMMGIADFIDGNWTIDA